jgi:ABC-type antimicrobial peptide transport system permease subunit
MERLVALPLSKSVEIAYKSIRVRFFRSLITTISLVLAVAFLCYIQASTDFANSILQNGGAKGQQALIKAGYELPEQGVTLGENAKQLWLIVLSLLVCTVGIVNAQLMAVTERFREIGTMKCLGALDRFILRLFLLEAGMQGFAGASVGALLGLLTAFLSALLTFGALTFTTFPVGLLGLTMIKAILIGCGLSLIGVIYPAITAARMAPVEAMRTEQ